VKPIAQPVSQPASQSQQPDDDEYAEYEEATPAPAPAPPPTFEWDQDAERANADRLWELCGVAANRAHGTYPDEHLTRWTSMHTKNGRGLANVDHFFQYPHHMEGALRLLHAALATAEQEIAQEVIA
jgi:hypothetical protein